MPETHSIHRKRHHNTGLDSADGADNAREPMLCRLATWQVDGSAIWQSAVARPPGAHCARLFCPRLTQAVDVYGSRTRRQPLRQVVT